jgi:plastocyanin
LFFLLPAPAALVIYRFIEVFLMWTRTLCVVVLAVLLPVAGFAQAAAEYGTVTSHSTGMGAGAGNAMGRAANALGGSAASATSSTSSGVTTVPSRGARPDPLLPVMRSNRQKLEANAGPQAATVHIASATAHAVVYVDNHAVAYAPAELRMSAGQHLIEVREPGFTSWRQQVTAAAGQKLELEPKLSPEGSNHIVVSFDKPDQGVVQ